MNSKKFSEAMSELDSKYVDEAINYKKKAQKPHWVKWGAMAACICFVICAVAIPRLFEKPNNSTSGDLSPMIYVNDTLYRVTSNQPDLNGKESQFVYLGVISSKVSSSQYPQENFQANDDIVGSAIYQFGKDIGLIMRCLMLTTLCLMLTILLMMTELILVEEIPINT